MKFSNSFLPNAFVKMSAIWSFVDTWYGSITPLRFSSRTEWQSTSICFVRSWKTWFKLIWIAGLLSLCIVISHLWSNHISRSNALTHFSSRLTSCIARYSTSADEHETVSCFLVCHEIGEEPSCMIHPVSDRLVRGHAAQSESHPVKWRDGSVSRVYLEPWFLLDIEQLLKLQASVLEEDNA